MTKADRTKKNLLVLFVDTCRNNRATHHNTPTLPLENNQIHRRRKRETRVTTDASKTISNGRTTRHYFKRLTRLFGAWFFWRYRWSCICILSISVTSGLPGWDWSTSSCTSQLSLSDCETALFNNVKYDWPLHMFLIELEYEEGFNSDCIDVNRTRRNSNEEREITP